MDLSAMVREYLELRAKINELKERQSEIQKTFDFLRNVTIPDQLAELDLKSARVDGAGTVSLHPILSVTQIQQDQLFEKLRGMGDGHLIKPAVNSSALRAYIKEGMEDQRFTESDWEGILNINGFLQARVTAK